MTPDRFRGPASLSFTGSSPSPIGSEENLPFDQAVMLRSIHMSFSFLPMRWVIMSVVT